MSIKPVYTYYKAWGNKILFKYRKNGTSFAKQIDFYKPSIFLPCQLNEDPDMLSLKGFPLKRKMFDDVKTYKEYVNTYKNVEGFTMHGNTDIGNQFVIEFYEGQMPKFNADEIRTGILDIEVYSPEGFPEPSEANWPINGITFYDNFTDTFYCIGDREYVHNKECEYVGQLNVKFTLCSDEVQLLHAMLAHFREFQYDVTSGWNSEFFDMPYIVNRCYKILGEKITKSSLSPFNSIRVEMVTGNFGKEQMKVDIVGLPHLDYQQLYKKHNFEPRESFKLDHIAKCELGDEDGKVQFDEDGLVALYKNNPQMFYTYNIVDVDIIRRLEKRLGFLYITYILAYYTLSNYEETLKTVKPWEKLIAKHLYNTGKVPPFARKYNEARDEAFEGAFVHPTQAGFWKWLLSIDLNSLYPMNIIQYNIGPETHIPSEDLPNELLQLRAKYTIDDLIHKRVDLSVLKKYNVTMTSNFQFYRRDVKSCIAEIMEMVYGDRKSYKKKMLAAESGAERCKSSLETDGASRHEYTEFLKEAVLNKNIQQSLKILLNSGYGAIGNAGFLYYLIENAEAITGCGQLVNKWTHERVNGMLNKIVGTTGVNRTIAGDTDSIYLCLNDVVEKAGIQNKSETEITDWLDKFHLTVLDPKIKDWTADLCDYMNASENKMVWGREAIAAQSVFVRKKGYTMRVIDSEGVRYETPKIKVVGLEAKKAAAFPEWSRKFLVECYKIGLTGTEQQLQKKVIELRKVFNGFETSYIAKPSGVSNVSKYHDPQTIYTKGTPKHVKAALVYNHLCDKHNLHAERIGDGHRMKYIELKVPNIINQEVVGFVRKLPDEFGLDRYIARDTIFESSFLSPLRIFLTALNWSDEELVTLF